MCLRFVILFALVGAAYTEFDIPNMDTLQLVNKLNLTPQLRNSLSDNNALQEQGNKTVEVFKKKCEQNGGVEAFEKVQNASTDFIPCIQTFVDMEKLKQEIEDAKPTGSVDEVFKKYCQNKAKLMSCISNMMEAGESCFNVKEREHLKSIYNISQEMVDFACFKDGDRLALFLSEGGVECFQEKQSELQTCFNETGQQNNIPTDLNSLSLENLPTISFDEQQCGQITVMQSCIIRVLESCQKPSTANIVEAMFKFLRNKTPCKAFPTAEKKKGSAAELISKMTSVFLGLMTVLLL